MQTHIYMSEYVSKCHFITLCSSVFFLHQLPTRDYFYSQVNKFQAHTGKKKFLQMHVLIPMTDFFLTLQNTELLYHIKLNQSNGQQTAEVTEPLCISLHRLLYQHWHLISHNSSPWTAGFLSWVGLFFLPSLIQPNVVQPQD